MNKWCDKCKTFRAGNYCAECGSALSNPPTHEITCPCCKGTGKVQQHSSEWWRYTYSQAALPFELIPNEEYKKIFGREKPDMTNVIPHDGAAC